MNKIEFWNKWMPQVVKSSKTEERRFMKDLDNVICTECKSAIKEVDKELSKR